MTPFNLEEYLENPSRKVVTRGGRPARIICWDRQCELEYNYPVIALVSVEHREVPVISNKEGKTWNNNEVNGLFFADEEEEMTEFEKALSDGIDYWIHEELKEPTVESVKGLAQSLLGIAKKELEKDLPKWKYMRNGACGGGDRDCFLIRSSEGYYHTSPCIGPDTTYIELDKLEKLPKEN